METSYLQWNLPNWITVTLMAVVGYVIISLAASVVGNKFDGAMS